METVISCVFFVFDCLQIQNCQLNYKKKTCQYCHPSQRNYLKDLFYRANNMDEEDEYLSSEFYYPEDLETSDVQCRH